MLSTSFLTACGGDDKEAPTKKNNSDKPKEEPKPDDNKLVIAERRLPTPREFFDVIREIGGKYRGELLAPLDVAEKLNDNKSRALLFGVYSADLAYISSFEFGTNALSYLDKLDNLANQMDLGGIFDKELRARIMKNDGNMDSLFAISDVAYIKSVEYLQMDRMEDVLGIMLAGGWIESMYIATSTAGPYQDGKPVFEQLKGQYVVLETIIDFLTPYADDAYVKELLLTLYDILDIYFSAGVTEQAATTEEIDGKTVLGGGNEIIMNAEVYGKIVEKIKQVRGQILSNELN